MDRYAVFVDAGYFFAAGAQAAFSGTASRKQLSLKTPHDLVAALCEAAVKQTNCSSLLRVYWYDAMPGPRLSLEQHAIALMSGVKLRLGVLNSVGEQKGVDALIVTDLIELARNRAISDAVLLSGDEDLRIAVQVAQSFGVRVHILAAGDPSRNVSPSLQMEADSVSSLPAGWFLNQLDRISKEASKPASSAKHEGVSAAGAVPDEVGVIAESTSKELLQEAGVESVQRLREHFKTSSSVPPEYDGKLIAKVAAKLSRQLSGDEKRQIRGAFVRAVRG